VDKKHEILKAAFRLFCDRGYGLSMADIAAAVGLKTPSLYSHFTGKHEIIEKIIEAEVLRFYAMLKTVWKPRARRARRRPENVFDASLLFQRIQPLRFCVPYRSYP
jgi:AcrR family transcriptional regulator